MPANRLKNTKRIVVKLGSNVITDVNSLNIKVIESISNQISLLMSQGIQVILVSSGAMAAGLKKMKLDRRPDEIPKRQAIAAIGQSGLMNAYERNFAEQGNKIAQILLTGEDLNNRKRYLNARNTINTLISWGVIPIINENDTVMVEEIKLGDNDNLAAMITLLLDADFLFILTDIDGLYDKDPRIHSDARLVSRVDVLSEKIEKYADSIPGTLGTGGMASKITAAGKVTSAGIPMIVARGDIPDILVRLFDGQSLGTYFVPKDKKMASRKCWIAHTLAPKGKLVIDEGASDALLTRGKSLLPAGISTVHGQFEPGAAVNLETADHSLIGKGLVNFSSVDIQLIKGLKSNQVEACLGGRHYDEVIHRDNMVLNQ